MQAIRRWATSVAASFETVVNQLENHEAVVTGALREMQEASGRANVQLARVKRDGETMRKRVTELRELDRVWAERAVASYALDKDRAKECIRRQNQCQKERAHLEEQLKDHAKLELQLNNDLKLIQNRIGELKRKKNTFAAREYRTEALRIGQVNDLGLIAQIDDVFDRWEMKLGECEGFQPLGDDFARKFESDDEEHEITEALEKLVQRAQANEESVKN